MSRMRIFSTSLADLPLARKLSAITLFACTVVLLLGSPVFLLHNLSTVRYILADDLSALAEVTALGVAPAVAFRDAPAANETLAALRADPGVLTAVVLLHERALFARYPSSGADVPLPPGIRDGADRDCHKGVYTFRPLTYSLCRDILLDGEVLGVLYLQSDLSPLWAEVRHHLLITALVLAGSFGFAWLLAHWLGQIIARPVRNLAATARQVTDHGDYTLRAERTGNDEVGALTDGFNTMLEAIERRDRELERHRDRLEDQVASRTAELTATMLKLEAARDQADAANRAKSQFLSRMSHELRTPMNAIIGFSQMLQLIENEPLTPTQEEYVRHIMRGGDHLMELINEVLDLSRVESGRVNLSVEAVDAAPVVADCLSIAGALASPREVSLIDNSAAARLPQLQVDRTRFRQVLLNLLSNGIKYNRPGGRVTLSAGLEPDRRAVRFTVADTGCGIPAERQSELFQPFNRLGADAGDVEGTGIGLVITRKLVELMDGRMGFFSTEGEGSSFWFSLPVHDDLPRKDVRSVVFDLAPDPDDPQPQSQPEAKREAPEVHARLVLYIEDNPANLRLMEEILRKEVDIELISAQTAELGLVMAESRHPDLILMDINLPGIDGFQALRLLRDAPGTRKVPVIAVSADSMPREVERGLREGFATYLTKPFRVPELLAAIRAALAG